MKILTVYAHPNPRSFCHAILERFTKGLEDAGHSSDVVDLYRIRFDPVFRMADFASYVHDSIPVEILEEMNLRERVLEQARDPVRRWLVRRWLRDKDPRTLAKYMHDHRPRDVIAQWEKVQNADGLAFIAPVFWLHFPAILKGWFERVFAYGDAYALTADGWHGNVRGRIPLLHHEKALVITTTMFREEDYRADWQSPMTRIIDEWGLLYPGIKRVEHVYFYSVPAVDDQTRKRYLERAYELGLRYAESPVAELAPATV